MSEVGAAAPRRPIISARGLRKSFGALEVLKGIDFDVLPSAAGPARGDRGSAPHAGS